MTRPTRPVACAVLVSMMWTTAGPSLLAAAQEASRLAPIADAPPGVRVRIERTDAVVSGDIVTVTTEAVTLGNVRAESGSPSIPSDRRLVIRADAVRRAAVLTKDYKSARDKNPEVLRFVAQSMITSGKKVELKTASGNMRGRLTEVSAAGVSIVFGNDRPSITTVVVPLAEVRELKPAGMPRALKAGILLGVGAFALVMFGLLLASVENSS